MLNSELKPNEIVGWESSDTLIWLVVILAGGLGCAQRDHTNTGGKARRVPTHYHHILTWYWSPGGAAATERSHAREVWDRGMPEMRVDTCTKKEGEGKVLVSRGEESAQISYPLSPGSHS